MIVLLNTLSHTTLIDLQDHSTVLTAMLIITA